MPPASAPEAHPDDTASQVIVALAPSSEPAPVKDMLADANVDEEGEPEEGEEERNRLVAYDTLAGNYSDLVFAY